MPSDQRDQIASQLSNVLEGVLCQHLNPRADGQGRVLAIEAMRATSGIRVCLRGRKVEQLSGLMEIAIQGGCHPIDECLANLSANGNITLDEVVHHCRDERRFAPDGVNLV